MITKPGGPRRTGSQNLDWHGAVDMAKTGNQIGDRLYMIRPSISVACGLLIAFAAPLAAQTPPAIVVELYTSQGCSSCPPADEFLGNLADDPGVIALALHVDYWDYIGWADKFADQKFTERQKAYAYAEGSKTIYTPQFIIGGHNRVVGNNPGEVAARIIEAMQGVGPVQLWLERKGDVVSIRAVAAKPQSGQMRVQLVRYRPSEAVEIDSGENAGHKITYHNIVTSWSNLGDWDGSSDFAVEAPAAGDQPIVVIVQTEGFGPIVAAAQIP